MTRDKLSPREAKFVQAMLDGHAKGKSAEIAGYAPASAAVNASRLLKRERVLTSLKEGAERKLHEGAAIGANVLLELAEKAKSEAVRLDAAKALLAHSGLAPIMKHETRHIIEDKRTDVELIEHIRSLAGQLGIKLPTNVIDAEFTPAAPAALPKPEKAPQQPAGSPPNAIDIFEGCD